MTSFLSGTDSRAASVPARQPLHRMRIEQEECPQVRDPKARPYCSLQWRGSSATRPLFLPRRWWKRGDPGQSAEVAGFRRQCKGQKSYSFDLKRIIHQHVGSINRCRCSQGSRLPGAETFLRRALSGRRTTRPSVSVPLDVAHAVQAREKRTMAGSIAIHFDRERLPLRVRVRLASQILEAGRPRYSPGPDRRGCRIFAGSNGTPSSETPFQLGSRYLGIARNASVTRCAG